MEVFRNFLLHSLSCVRFVIDNSHVFLLYKLLALIIEEFRDWDRLISGMLFSIITFSEEYIFYEGSLHQGLSVARISDFFAMVVTPKR